MSKYLEPDANQARIRSREPRARAKPRARRASGQAPRPEARSNALSQTRCRPRTEARGQDVRPEPGTFQASIRGTSLATMPKCLTRSGGGGRAERERARACARARAHACVRVHACVRACARAHVYKKQYLTHKGQEKSLVETTCPKRALQIKVPKFALP